MDTSEPPRLAAATYICFVSPAAGFGVFAAVPIKRPHRWSRDSCIGSYGGFVGTRKELLGQTESYEFTGSLPRAAPAAKRPAEEDKAPRNKYA